MYIRILLTLLHLTLASLVGLAETKPALPTSIVFWARPHALEPSQVTVAAGDIHVVVFNSTTATSVEAVITRQVGQQLKTINIPSARRLSGSIVSLTPGTYSLTIAGRSDWSSTITVK